MDTPSKEQIRKAKKSEANKRFREKVKTEKESSQDTESVKSDTKSSNSNVFFMSNTLRLSSNGVTQPEKEPDLLPQVGYLPANF